MSSTVSRRSVFERSSAAARGGSMHRASSSLSRAQPSPQHEQVNSASHRLQRRSVPWTRTDQTLNATATMPGDSRSRSSTRTAAFAAPDRPGTSRYRAQGLPRPRSRGRSEAGVLRGTAPSDARHGVRSFHSRSRRTGFCTRWGHDRRASGDCTARGRRRRPRTTAHVRDTVAGRGPMRSVSSWVCRQASCLSRCGRSFREDMQHLLVLMVGELALQMLAIIVAESAAQGACVKGLAARFRDRVLMDYTTPRKRGTA